MSGGKGGGENLGSILDTEVHIATPAQSPPLSPRMLERKERKERIINQTIIISPYATLTALLM